MVVGGDDEQSGAEVEGDDHAPQVAPGRDAGHGADRRHHVEHLQGKKERNSFQTALSLHVCVCSYVDPRRSKEIVFAQLHLPRTFSSSSSAMVGLI